MRKFAAIWGSMKPFLFGAVGAVTILNGCVAVLAFLKDVMMATLLGTSVQADALTLAYFLPDTIGSNLVAAALGVACVPVFSRLLASGERERLRRAVREAVLLYTAIAVAVTTGISIWSRELVQWTAGGLDSELGIRTLSLFRILVLIMVPFPAIAVGISLLQSARRFAVPAAIPLVPHLFGIAAIGSAFAFGLGATPAVTLVAAGIAAGAGAMVVLAWIAVGRSGLLKPVGKRAAEPEGTAPSLRDQREIWRLFGPYLLILLSSQSVNFVERTIAATFEAGTVAGLNYAFRLAQFPIWVFVAAVYSVALPSLAEDVALGEQVRLKQTLARAFKDILVVTVPTVYFLFLLREPIVSALFQRGAFDAASVHVTASLLAGYSLTIVGQAVAAICLRYFLAAGDIRIPLLMCLTASAANIILDYMLAGSLGAVGLSYGAAIGATLSAALLLSRLASQLKLSARSAGKPLRIIGAANLIPFAVTWALSELCARTAIFHHASSLQRIGIITGIVIAVSIVYIVILHRFQLIRFPRSDGHG